MATSTNKQTAQSAQKLNEASQPPECFRFHRPTWQVELIQQQAKLQLEVEGMQTFRNGDVFYHTNRQMQEGLDKQLEATRNLLHVVNERISYFI